MSAVEANPVEPSREPWLGLASYSEADSELFFGRERETEELLRLLRREVLTVVFGPSGTGKTSLLNAGLSPRLREANFLPIVIRLDHSGTRGSYSSYIRAIVAAAIQTNGIDEEALAEPHAGPDDETLWEYLHRVEFWDKRNNAITPVLVFDQFEEIFTLGRNGPATGAFLAELADLAENYVPAVVRSRLEKSGGKLPFAHSEQRYKLLLSLREDYVSRLDGLRQAMPSVMHNRFPLTRMNGEQALIAVEKPGRGIVDETVSRQIVLFVAAANESAASGDNAGASFKNLRVEPALLSVVCRELNARRLHDGKDHITKDLLEATHSGILDNFYNRGFEGLFAPARVFVEDRLLTASGFRGTVPLEEAAHAGVAESAIRTLVDRRLIRIEERLGIPHVELTHDLLTKVVQKSRDGRRERERREKEERQHAEREAQRRKQLRRTRRWLAVAVCAAAIFFVLGVLFTTYSNRKAEAARVEAMFISRATASLSDDPERGLILAMYAMDAAARSKPDLLALAEEVMHRALLASQTRLTLQGQGNLNGIVYSADGTRVATAGADNTAKLWDTATGAELATFRGHTDNVVSVAFSPDAKRLVTGSWDATAKVWDIGSGREIAALRGHGGKVNAVAFSPDGKRIATASEDKTVKLWDAANGKELLTLRGHRFAVYAVAFSAGKLIASGSADNTVKLWDAVSGRPLRTLEGHENSIRSVAFSPDGSRLASASLDHTAKLWDTAAGRELLTFRGNKDNVNSVAFSPHGTRIATGGADRTARIWDAETGEELFTLRGHRQEVWGVAFNPGNENRFATASWDKTAKLWEISGSEFLRLRGHERGTDDVVFSPDGKRLATAGEDSTARLWDASTGQELLTLQHEAPVYCLAYTSDGTKLASAGKDGKVRLWDARAGKLLTTFVGHQKDVYGIAISPDDKLLATASLDGTAKLWDLASGREVRTFTGHKDKVSGVGFSPDGTRLATAGSDATAKIWDVKTGREILTLTGHEEAVRSVAFSPDGTRVVTAGDDFSARVWDAVSGKELFDLRAHQGAVWSAAYSPDGRHIATASADKTSKLWDARSGQLLLTLGGHQDAVFTAVFSPDGNRLATASKDESVQIYVLDTAGLMDLARKRITRKLARSECQEYFQTATCPPLP